MDNSNMSRNRHNNDHLSVSKMGKNIRKSPVHQPSFTDAARQQPQPQPQVYNINKNDFRNFVQQLTGSPSHEAPSSTRYNLPRPPSMRLQRIRPPPLSPMNRPQMPIRPQAPTDALQLPAAAVPYNNNLVRAPAQFGQPSPAMLRPGDSFLANRAESPISAYMRYLQTNFIDSGPINSQAQPLPQLQPQVPGQIQPQPPSTSLLPNPTVLPLPSLRVNGPPPLPSPQMNVLPFLPSPSIFPSPTGFLNMLYPLSPYPLLSPGDRPPLTPNFAFSPMAQSGILGPGPPFSQPPQSPDVGFPLSPGFFTILSPRWRER